jgi:hypothetical protein
VCGTAPTLTGLNTAGTAVGTDCAAVGISPALESPPLTLSPSPDVVSASPKPAAPSPTPSGVPVGVVASPKPSPPPVQISNQPVCTCAMAGYGSDSCKGALTTYCATKKDPACDTAKSAGTDAAAATTLSQLLQRECFAGQDMTADACSCTTVRFWGTASAGDSSRPLLQGKHVGSSSWEGGAEEGQEGTGMSCGSPAGDRQQRQAVIRHAETPHVKSAQTWCTSHTLLPSFFPAASFWCHYCVYV